jgi:hypothetical protein
MRTRTLVILALITIAVLAYIQFFAGKEPGTYEREMAARQVMNLVTADINHLEITSAKGSFVFNKDDKAAWQMQSPIKYPANGDAISSLLSQLSFTERKVTLDASQLGDLQQSLAQFGLKSPETVLKLRTKSGANYELALGKETAVAGALYARIVQDGVENYIVVEQSLAPFIQKSLDQWRSSTVFNFTSEQVQGLVLHQESKDVEVKKEGKDWKITKPLTANADENEIRSFLANLLGVQATQFVTDNPAEYTNYSLNSPYLVLDINLGKENVSLRIGRVDANNETKYYAQQTARPAVFVVQKSTVDFIANLLDAVRDRRLMRAGGTESIVSIAYQKGDFNIEFNRLPGMAATDWELAETGKLPVDAAEVQALLTKLGNARATNYQLATDDNRVALGLKNPAAQVVFKIQDDTNKQAEPKVCTLKFAAAKKGEMAVESSFRDDIVTVPADVLVGLPSRLTDWLSKSVKIYDVPAITSVSWKRGGEVTTIAKDSANRWPQSLADKKIDLATLNHQLMTLSGIPAQKWREVTDKEFADPVLTLTVAHDKEQKVLEIVHDARLNEYLARLAGDTYGFTVGVRDFDLLNLLPLVPAK